LTFSIFKIYFGLLFIIDFIVKVVMQLTFALDDIANVNNGSIKTMQQNLLGFPSQKSLRNIGNYLLENTSICTNN